MRLKLEVLTNNSETKLFIFLLSNLKAIQQEYRMFGDTDTESDVGCPHFEDIWDAPGGPIQVDFANNPSDALFARLFVNKSESESSGDSQCIPWKYCDLVLSVIRDPHFSSRDVTFKDCGDMFRCIGRRRQEGWSVVEARPKQNISFPQVVLEGVLDCIKTGMEKSKDILRADRWKYPDASWTGWLEGWRDTLQNVALVHSLIVACECPTITGLRRCFDERSKAKFHSKSSIRRLDESPTHVLQIFVPPNDAHRAK